MIILALIWIGEGHTKWQDVDLVRMKGLPELWGTVIYCFMCHHRCAVEIWRGRKKRKSMKVLCSWLVQS